MAAAYRTSAADGASSGTGNRTCAITPAVGDLLVVFCNASGNTNATPTCSDNNGSGTYTLITTALKNTSADTLSVFVRTALMVNTTSTTVTVATGSNTAGEIVIVALSGMTQVGAAAVLQSAVQANQAASTTPAPAFSSSALTANVTLGAVANSTATAATMTEPTNWTERQDVGQGSPNTGLEVVSRDSGFTGTTVTWGSASSTAFASVILEMNGSSVTNTSRTPTVGSVAAAGVAAAFVLGTILTPLVGALTLSPQPMIYGPAAYTQQGTLFLGDWTNTDLTPGAGGLALTGGAALNDLGVIGSAGSATLLGAAATLATTLTPAVGGATLTGAQPSVVAATSLAPSAGGLSASGTTFFFDSGILSSVGTLTLTGIPPAPPSATLTPTVGGLILSGGQAGMSSDTSRTPGVGELFLGLTFDVTAAPSVGTLALTGATVQVTGSNTSLTPPGGELFLGLLPNGQPTVGALALVGSAPTLAQNDTSLEPSVGSLVVNGGAPALGGEPAGLTPLAGALTFGLPDDRTALPFTGTLALTGRPANPPPNTDVTPDAGRLSFVRNPNAELMPGAGGLALTGAQANPPDNTALTPLTGSLLLTLGTVAPRSGALAFQGLAPTVNATISMMLGAAPLTLTGYEPIAQTSGPPPFSANVQPRTGTLDLASAVPTLGTLTSPTLQPGATALVLTPFVNLNGRGMVVPSGSLALVGVQVAATQSNYDYQPLTGALTLTGLGPFEPIVIDARLAIEGCGSVNGTATEGCASTTAIATEGCTSLAATATGTLV